MTSTSRQMVSVPKTVVRIGLTSEEADRLAAEPARLSASDQRCTSQALSSEVAVKRLTELLVKYRFVTPAFLGGSDPRQAELRSPSIKAALRSGTGSAAWSPSVVRWRRAGFRRYWNSRSRRGGRGRRRASAELCTLVRRLATEKPDGYDARQHRDRGAVLPKVGSMQVQS